MSDLTVEHSVRIQAPVSDAWGALTNAERMTAWYRPATVESSFEVGTPIHFSLTLNGKAYRDHGTILAVEPLRCLRFNHFAKVSRRPDTPDNRTTVTLTLDSADGRTTVHVRHEGFHTDVDFKHARFFWRNALFDLKQLLESGAQR